MNPLQEHAHLFANGKFKAQWRDQHSRIIGIDNFGKTSSVVLLNPDGGFKVAVEKCTLIARPIEDMTDEEWSELGWGKSIMSDPNLHMSWSPLEFVHLLSIGVYPFDQSHFEDGTIIDATKGQEAV